MTDAILCLKKVVKMKIVLCDDELNLLDKMRNLIIKISPDAKIYMYSSAKELIKTDIAFDIAFLDIEMDDGAGGFDAAQHIKRKNEDCIIAFFTNYDSYARKGYEYRAYRFILKDEGNTMIYHHFSETIKEYYRIAGQVTLIYGSGKRRVAIKDIMYLKMKDHYAAVYISDGTECLWRKSMSEIEQYLSKYDFERCHNSYIVNMEYVREKNKNRLILFDGNAISISRKYIKCINDKY